MVWTGWALCSSVQLEVFFFLYVCCISILQFVSGLRILNGKFSVLLRESFLIQKQYFIVVVN